MIFVINSINSNKADPRGSPNLKTNFDSKKINREFLDLFWFEKNPRKLGKETKNIFWIERYSET